MMFSIRLSAIQRINDSKKLFTHFFFRLGFFFFRLELLCLLLLPMLLFWFLFFPFFTQLFGFFTWQFPNTVCSLYLQILLFTTNRTSECKPSNGSHNGDCGPSYNGDNSVMKEQYRTRDDNQPQLIASQLLCT